MTIKSENNNHLKETRTELLDILQKLKTQGNSRNEIREDIYTLINSFGSELSIYALLLYCTLKLREHRVSNGRKQHYKNIHNNKILYHRGRYSYKYKTIYL